MPTPSSLYNASITEAAIPTPSSLDPRHLRLLTYSRPHDTCDGIELHLGNQAMGYPFSCLGHEWKCVEFLYLCGEWSWASDDALAIQRDLLTAKSGYAARRFKKPKYAKQIRPDFPSFRHQWMLWCVWQKCLGSKPYRDHLLSMPDDRVIVEVVQRDPVGPHGPMPTASITVPTAWARSSPSAAAVSSTAHTQTSTPTCSMPQASIS